jgi:hypothetical protein
VDGHDSTRQHRRGTCSCRQLNDLLVSASATAQASVVRKARKAARRDNWRIVPDNHQTTQTGLLKCRR